MRPTRARRPLSRAALAAAAALAFAACHSASHADAPAGTVVAIEGHASARRAHATTSRGLALDASIFADDSVTTGSGASVQIRFAHNGARWSLGPSQSRRVADSVAWTAAKDPTSEALLHSDDPKIETIGAGRHGEHEGVSSSEAALRPSPTPTSTSQPGEVTVMGHVDPAPFVAVIRKSNPEFRACYEAGLERNPDLTGRIAIAFVVGSNGALIRAEIERSTLNDAATEACVLRSFRTLRFPAPAGGGVVKLTYPLQFGSPPAPAASP